MTMTGTELLNARLKMPWPLALLGLLWVTTPCWSQPRQNVLFIAVDDLRTELGCYGVKEAQSPYLDQFARQTLGHGVFGTLARTVDQPANGPRLRPLGAHLNWDLIGRTAHTA